MEPELTVADVFSFCEKQLPLIIEVLAKDVSRVSKTCLIVEGLTKVYVATFLSRESMEEFTGYIVPIALPVFTDECDGVKIKLCKELAQQALAGYVQTIQDNANALLNQMDEAAMKIYKGLAEIKLAQGFDIDTIIDQLDGEHALHSSQLDELWNHLEAE